MNEISSLPHPFSLHQIFHLYTRHKKAIAVSKQTSMDQPRRQRVSQLASRQTRVISGNRRRGYTGDDEEDASALLCGSIEDLGEDAKFLLQAGDHEDREVLMSRAAKLTAIERMMLPSRVVSRIVKADNKLRTKRRAAKRREEKKKLDAELNQAIAARLAQPRGTALQVGTMASSI